MTRTLLVTIVSFALGASGGWLMRGSRDVTRLVMNPLGVSPLGVNKDSPVRAASAPLATIASSAPLDLAQLRAVVREEISAAFATSRGVALPRIAPAFDAPPPTPELIAQRQAAVVEVETMIKGGEWGNDQRMTFQQRMATLDPEQGARLLREVTKALNDGTLHVTTAGPPL
jgi:hypothetical protein